MPTHRRYKAPAEDGAVLADPPVDQWPALVDANRRLLDRAGVTVGGLPLRDLRALARREVLGAARRYTAGPSGEFSGDGPLVLAGHQPELSHPGVWVKHFALNGLARRVGGTPLNLVVDNDTLKSTSLRFPALGDGPAAVRTETIPFDAFESELPYEDRGIHDPELLRTFANRTESVWKSWGYVPLLPEAWADVTSCPGAKIGERFAYARRRWERAWGCANLELPVSRLVATEAFARFVWYVLTDLPRFREVYNEAVHDYRRENGMRSANHPAPDLAKLDDRDEAPFWVCPLGRRARLTVRRIGRDFDLWGEPGRIGPVPSDPSGFLADFRTAIVPLVRLRPRALTLTLFARLVLGDFFIHGIGGGKYDEVTDRIIRDYFGVDPPRYAVLSATLHLPLPPYPHTAADARAVARHARDLYWNPQRYADNDSGADRLRREKAALIAAEPPVSDHVARKQWFRDLQSVTERLRPLVADQLARSGRQFGAAHAEAQANAVLTRRDYAWVLYPEDALRPFLARFL